MGCFYFKGKGIFVFVIFYFCNFFVWFKIIFEQVVDQICKFVKKGVIFFQIGVIFCDFYGVVQIKVVIGMFLNDGKYWRSECRIWC